MKGYKRFTKRKANGEATFATSLTANSIYDAIDEAFNRLADLEEKIESGELCDRDEVRKKAEEIRDNLEQKGRFELSSYDGKEYLTISTDAFNKIFNQYIKNA